MTDSYIKTLPQPRVLSVVDFFCGCGGMSMGFQGDTLDV